MENDEELEEETLEIDEEYPPTEAGSQDYDETADNKDEDPTARLPAPPAPPQPLVPTPPQVPPPWKGKKGQNVDKGKGHGKGGWKGKGKKGKGGGKKGRSKGKDGSHGYYVWDGYGGGAYVDSWGQLQPFLVS